MSSGVVKKSEREMWLENQIAELKHLLTVERRMNNEDGTKLMREFVKIQEENLMLHLKVKQLEQSILRLAEEKMELTEKFLNHIQERQRDDKEWIESLKKKF